MHVSSPRNTSGHVTTLYLLVHLVLKHKPSLASKPQRMSTKRMDLDSLSFPLKVPGETQLLTAHLWVESWLDLSV